MSGRLFLGAVEKDYADFLRDESRLVGRADTLSFPETEAEIREVLAGAQADGLPVTVQGARTGITGGAVPARGHVLNLSRMTRFRGVAADPAGGYRVTVEPGLPLKELNAFLRDPVCNTVGWAAEAVAALTALRRDRPQMFTPDPTETTASLGGMVACNASGARSFRYGATRGHVAACRLVLADGDVLALRRDVQRATGGSFELATKGGRRLSGRVPSYRPPPVKSAAGYYAADDMDLLDLFIGSEGTLGIFSELELVLRPLPPAIWGVVAFFPAEEAAIRFVRRVRGDGAAEGGVLRPAAMEFFDHHALDLLRRRQAGPTAIAEIPELPPAFHTAVFLEYHGDSDDQVGDAVTAMAGGMVEAGGREDDTWIATDSREIERLHLFRHAVPETVNGLIDERRKTHPGLIKLGTDMAVPDDCLAEVLRLYHESLAAAGLEYVMFGHIGNNHLHVNILPRRPEEYEQGRALYLQWADRVVGMGGTVSAEHGIGKIKTALLRRMFGDAAIAEMRALRDLFDPGRRLNPGNLFD